ncbi:MAG TPA: GAF domain-containing protein [Deltaproteobacteria bacterium]|nr:GAF domain-containing protein [Deltaproteobacteria bacterium]
MDRPYLESLYELARELNTSEDITTMLGTVINHLPKVLGARYCSLFTRNPSSGELELKAHNHLDIGEDPFITVGTDQESVMNLAIGRKSSLIIRDIEEEIGLQNKDKYSTKSFMCIMIKHADEVLGILNLADKATNSFTRDDMLVTSIITELLGALLARIEYSAL